MREDAQRRVKLAPTAAAGCADNHRCALLLGLSLHAGLGPCVGATNARIFSWVLDGRMCDCWHWLERNRQPERGHVRVAGGYVCGLGRIGASRAQALTWGLTFELSRARRYSVATRLERPVSRLVEDANGL